MTIWNTVAWIFSGPVILVFFVLRDFWYMFRILTMHMGCRTAAGLQDELPQAEVDDDEEVRCCNEARKIVIRKYLEVKKAMKGDMEDDGEEKEIDFDNLKILDMLAEDEEMIEENRSEFIIKASSLVDAWKKDQTVRMKAEEEAANEEENKKKNIEETPEEKETREKTEAERQRLANSKIGQLKQTFVDK